jgi:hypothetical protein
MKIVAREDRVNLDQELRREMQAGLAILVLMLEIEQSIVEINQLGLL